MDSQLNNLLTAIKACQICKGKFSHQPNPVVSFNEQSQILVIGQAPGTKVHASGVPWDDASGRNLRKWLGVTPEQFYNPDLFGIVPMGFCYPGKGKSGDLPPRPECAPEWHPQIFNHLKNVKLTLLIGQYAQKYYLDEGIKPTLTETVKNFQAYLPNYFCLVHPSPRNGIWQRKNPWFEDSVVPVLRKAIVKIIQ